MTMRSRILLTLAALVVLTAAALSQSGEKPVNWKGLPDPFHTPSASNRPQVVAKPEGAGLTVPAGFKVEE